MNLVKKQPNPSFFYKSFLELDGANMVTILAFDSGSMEHLLNDDNEEYYNPLYPVIYRTKTQKKNNKHAYYYNTAIDNALKNNQVKAVNLMIDYISKYQNSYVSSYLFKNNLPIIMEKGIVISKLICDDSSIFKITFDYDDWPGIHTDDSKLIRPYTDSYFNIRFHYNTCFPEEEYASIEGKDVGGEQVFKIKYSINLLPSIAIYINKHQNPDGSEEFTVENEDVSIVSLFQDTEEDEIFEASCVQEVIEYKWETFGMRFHCFGFIMHIVYVVALNIYVAASYQVENTKAQNDVYVIILCFGILYPWIYDFT